MKDWKEGQKVHFNIPGGANATIVKYAGQFFWTIRMVEGQREMIAHQDDLAEGWRGSGE